MQNKEANGDKLIQKAEALCKPSLISLRLKPDWLNAAPLYEQALNAYKVAKCWSKAKTAAEKAAECQQHIGSTWHAGKMYEAAGEMAKEMQDYAGLAEIYSYAAQAYFEAGRPQAGCEALYKAATKIEASLPEKASELYKSAIDSLDQDERFTIGPDVYRSAASHEIKKENWDSAASILFRFASTCADRDLTASACRSYLGVIVIWLYAQNPEEAVSVLNDTSSIDMFLSSDEYKAAEGLIGAYRKGDAAAIKSVVSNSTSFQFLDASVGRLAKKLPVGDLAALSSKLQTPSEDLEDLT